MSKWEQKAIPERELVPSATPLPSRGCMQAQGSRQSSASDPYGSVATPQSSAFEPGQSVHETSSLTEDNLEQRADYFTTLSRNDSKDRSYWQQQYNKLLALEREKWMLERDAMQRVVSDLRNKLIVAETKLQQHQLGQYYGGMPPSPGLSTGQPTREKSNSYDADSESPGGSRGGMAPSQPNAALFRDTVLGMPVGSVERAENRQQLSKSKEESRPSVSWSNSREIIPAQPWSPHGDHSGNDEASNASPIRPPFEHNISNFSIPEDPYCPPPTQARLLRAGSTPPPERLGVNLALSPMAPSEGDKTPTQEREHVVEEASKAFPVFDDVKDDDDDDPLLTGALQLPSNPHGCHGDGKIVLGALNEHLERMANDPAMSRPEVLRYRVDSLASSISEAVATHIPEATPAEQGDKPGEEGGGSGVVDKGENQASASATAGHDDSGDGNFEDDGIRLKVKHSDNFGAPLGSRSKKINEVAELGL